jgi:predicted MFS family arabinose efflux permease
MPSHRPAAQADIDARNGAAVLSLTLPGDTVLYLLLPLHAATFGVSLAEAGFLLAANRLVRIAGYGWIARGYNRFGPRVACLVATLAAAASTLGYATLSGVWALVVARLLWGLAFAAFNIAVQALATAEPAGAARRNGRSRAIISVGPMLGLPVGALLSEWVGPRAVFFVLAGAALLALPLAARLPDASGPVARGGPRFALPSRLDVWSFVQGLTLDGLFVVGLAVLAAAALPGNAALAAGAAMALRYFSEIVFAPVGGGAAERWGSEWLLLLLSLASAAGLVLIGMNWLWTGAVTVVLLRGLLQPLPAPIAVARSRPGEGVLALARLATWRDIGAGLGPMIAGLLLPVLPPFTLYGAAALLLAVSALADAPRQQG